MIAFRVHGKPVPKQSFKFTRRGGGYTPHHIAGWQETVALEALKAMQDAGLTLMQGELSVSLMFFLPDRRRRDLDNLSKAVLDAMNGVVYADDQQVTALRIIKVYGNVDPGVDVEVKGITTDHRGVVAVEYEGESISEPWFFQGEGTA